MLQHPLRGDRWLSRPGKNEVALGIQPFMPQAGHDHGGDALRHIVFAALLRLQDAQPSLDFVPIDQTAVEAEDADVDPGRKGLAGELLGQGTAVAVGSQQSVWKMQRSGVSHHESSSSGRR